LKEYLEFLSGSLMWLEMGNWEGMNIDVIIEPWTRGDQGRCLSSPQYQGVYELTVFDLMTVGEKRWDIDIDKVSSLFSIEVTQTIIDTPLFVSVQKDRLIWTDDQKGLYSVRLGCRLIMNELLNVDRFRVEGDWTCLWRVSAPHKPQNLFWSI